MRHNYNNRLKLNNNYRSEYRELFQFHFAKLKLSFYMNINPIILLLLYGERNETNYSVSTNSFDIILYCMDSHLDHSLCSNTLERQNTKQTSLLSFINEEKNGIIHFGMKFHMNCSKRLLFAICTRFFLSVVTTIM